MKPADLRPVVIPPRAGATSGTTDASGLITVAHGGPTTPVAIVVSGRNSAWEPVLVALTSTTFTVRIQRRSTEATAPGSLAGIAFDWMCFY